MTITRPHRPHARRPITSLCGLLLGLAGLTAVPLCGVATAQPRPEPAPVAPADASARERQHAELHVRYAEARVRLAEADLAKAHELNQRFPNAVPAAELAELEDRIRLLRDLAKAARDKPHGNGLALQRAAARSAAARARMAVESARAARAVSENAVSPIDLERLERKAEVAELRAQLWDDPVLVPSLIDEMQVQIEQLQEQVLELVTQLELVRKQTITNP